MPITPLFSASNALSTPTSVSLVDISTGSDSAITGRRVYLQKADGSYLKPTGTTTGYVLWAYGSPSININVLNKDYCLNIIVQWVNVSGSVLYSTSQLKVFTINNENCHYSCTLRQVVDYSLINDSNYYDTKKKLRVELDGAYLAKDVADIVGSQNCLDRATAFTKILCPTNTFITATGAVAATTYTAVYGWAATDPYTALQTADAFTYQGTGTFLLNSAIVSDVHTAPNNQWFVWREPSTEPVKTTWFDTSFNNGQIPDSVMRAAFIARGFRYYVTRILATFTQTSTSTVTLSS